MEKSEVKEDKVTIRRNKNVIAIVAKGNQIDISIIGKPKANLILRLQRIPVWSNFLKTVCRYFWKNSKSASSNQVLLFSPAIRVIQATTTLTNHLDLIHFDTW